VTLFVLTAFLRFAPTVADSSCSVSADDMMDSCFLRSIVFLYWDDHMPGTNVKVPLHE
jgi:hypothetical protein